MSRSEVIETIEEELIFGAMRREKQWKLATLFAGLVAMGSLVAAAIVVLSYTPPPPVLIPYNPETGMAMPNATVRSISLAEREAVIEAAVYRYVIDRESYNQIDNDLRIRRALSQSSGRARTSLSAAWDSGNASYPPARYGDRAEIQVNVLSISHITNDRAQIRLQKRLVSPDGLREGDFTIVLAYDFDPATQKSLEAVWQNPFGFTVTDYNITSDKRERDL
ncbi:virB8 family protein [Tropicimonas isoalkanivorans]|uniref:Type IV secretion system protein VirB8 n=1 Tax=Tropicimonas isoalkanivorans TaxID=441112 RepID=A0A1I1PXG7_9RHOB|nr:type IV secretion system protein [Tropicimonas isoalkanivorans]SFD14611.1 type IV secretion system protein VirB8 [Tropicimonas isoalkanivorans]